MHLIRPLILILGLLTSVPSQAGPKNVLFLGDSLSSSWGGIGYQFKAPETDKTKVAALCGASPATYLADYPKSPCGGWFGTTYVRGESALFHTFKPLGAPTLTKLLQFKHGRADLVVIELGTNLYDASYDPATPDFSAWVASQVLNFVDQVLVYAPGAKILWISPPCALQKNGHAITDGLAIQMRSAIESVAATHQGQMEVVDGLQYTKCEDLREDGTHYPPGKTDALLAAIEARVRTLLER